MLAVARVQRSNPAKREIAVERRAGDAQAIRHHVSSSTSDPSAATTAPPTTSLCPFRYFVVECTTMSAPSKIGCLQCRREKRVVDHEQSAPAECAAAATRRMSVIRSSGLLGVSIQTSRGRRRAMSASACGPVRSAKTSAKCAFAERARSSRCVPP